jgi:NADPH:quinone reductase-like Zn-dependent oxidoreductase
MQAVVHDQYGSPDVLELRDVDPPVPADGEVLVSVRAAGVDRGVWHLLTGRPYLVRVVAFPLRPSRSPIRGWEFAGIAETAGDGVQLGDEVYGTCAGSFAEFACAEVAKIAPKPSNLSFEQAAAVPVSGGTALQGLRDHGKVRAGQRVLITGAGGGVGTFAVQLAKAFGAEVTGVCSAGKVELVRSLGADRVIDRGQEDFADGRERYDLILDTAGVRSLSDLRRALTPDGTAVIVGGEGGGRWLGGFQRQIFWAPLGALRRGRRVRALAQVERGDDLRYLNGLFKSGQVTPVIERTYPLAEAAEAVRRLESGEVGGKLVLTLK